MWLVEVFNIVYKGYIDLKPDQLIGTIKVNDGVHDHYLYIGKAEKRKPSLKRLDEVVLSGPTKGSISGKGSVNFNVDILCGAYKESFTLFDRDYNRSTSSPFEKKIVSKDGRGEICMMYALYNDATEVRMKVKLFPKAGFFKPEVYGVVAASTSDIQIIKYSTMLFIKKESEKINVRRRKHIPLSRSLVAVPLGSVLFVDMHLIYGDEVLVEGRVEFQPKKSGSEVMFLDDKDNKVRVEVEVTYICK